MIMENIFENAYFGKPYKTRDGRKALYLDSFYRLTGEKHVLAIEHMEDNLLYVFSDGMYEPVGAIDDRKENNNDIISEWQEEINEEELDKLAYDYCPEERTWATINGYKERDAFRAGYRKAKEE